jgi:hypothetical protein
MVNMDPRRKMVSLETWMDAIRSQATDLCLSPFNDVFPSQRLSLSRNMHKNHMHKNSR